MVGPDYPCMLVTYLLIVGGGLLTCVFQTDEATWQRTCMFGWTILTFFAFSMAACSDPGIIFNSGEDKPPELDVEAFINNPAPNSAPPQTDLEAAQRRLKAPTTAMKFTKCVHCEVYRTAKASHCYECNLCIEELDHHCPWTGKCIGKKTIRRFYFFLFAVATQIIFAIVLLTLNAMEWTNNIRNPRSS